MASRYRRVYRAQLATRLDDLVDEGAGSIHLIAHSMGGLVASVLMLDARYKGAAWREKVKQVITVATPFGGAPLAIYRLLGKEGDSGIPGSAFAKMRAIPELASAAQLMPPADSASIWTIQRERIESGDLYAPGGFGEQQGFDRQLLDRVQRLHEILKAPWPDGVARFQIAGSGNETMTRLAVPNEVVGQLDADSGDETVPISSATRTSAPMIILKGKHLPIINSGKVRRIVRALLGSDQNAVIFSADSAREVARSSEQDVELSLPSLGVHRRQGHVRFEVLLSLGQPAKRTLGFQLIVRALMDGGRTDSGAPVLAERTGQLLQDMENLVIPMELELSPGPYRISVELAGGLIAEDTLLVYQ